MHYLRPIILFALSCGIVAGQRLGKPTGYFHTSSLSWMSKYEQAQRSSVSLEYEAEQKRVALQAALGRKEIIAEINQPRLNGNALAAIYRACTGRRVIVSGTAASAEFSLVLHASPKHPITNAQLREIIKRSAVVEGFNFTPDGGDSDIDVLTPVEGIRCVEKFPPVFTENTPLPEGDAVISYVMSLKYLKPNKAIRIFTKLIDQTDPYSSIAPVPNAHAIVATYRTSIIRKLIEVKGEMDKP